MDETDAATSATWATAATAEVFAYVGVGSNQGDAVGNLAAGCLALTRLFEEALPGARLTRASSVYRTEPLEMPGQPFFANQVVELACDPALPPEALLERMLAVETRQGRVRPAGVRYASRALDLDLLLFGAVRMQTPRLTLPHPRMLERAFVLAPLAQLAPDLRLPQGLTAREALGRIAYTIDKEGTIFQGSI